MRNPQEELQYSETHFMQNLLLIWHEIDRLARYANIPKIFSPRCFLSLLIKCFVANEGVNLTQQTDELFLSVFYKYKSSHLYKSSPHKHKHNHICRIYTIWLSDYQILKRGVSVFNVSVPTFNGPFSITNVSFCLLM